MRVQDVGILSGTFKARTVKDVLTIFRAESDKEMPKVTAWGKTKTRLTGPNLPGQETGQALSSLIESARTKASCGAKRH